jgi:hypothetical protein
LPFKTIARAARSVLPGTIIHVAPGTYPGGFKTTASGTAAARIHFVSTVRWGARIVPPAGSTNSTAWDKRGDFVDIVGFDIDGAGARGGIAWLHGIYTGGSHVAIRGNHVHHIALAAPCNSAGGSAIGVDGSPRGPRRCDRQQRARYRAGRLQIHPGHLHEHLGQGEEQSGLSHCRRRHPPVARCTQGRHRQ